MDDLTALIVCGGRGRRLGPLADLLHKTLLPADGAPILVHVLDAVVSAFRCPRIIFLTGHLSWQIEHVVRAYDPPAEVEFLIDEGALGTADAVCRALRMLRLERFVYAHGNIALGEESVRRISAAAAGLAKYESLLAVSREDIAPTHPTVRLSTENVDPPRSPDGSALLFSVGFGLIQGSGRCLLEEARPSACTLEDYLFGTESGLNVLRGVDIGSDWRHLEDLTFYGGEGVAAGRPERWASPPVPS